jgi:PPK2 family polyphosphate:nucleotide phosphotransferase
VARGVGLRATERTMTGSKARSGLRSLLAVPPGTNVSLASFDPSTTHGHRHDEAEGELRKGVERLSDLQDRLWAERKHAVLIVLQGIDTAGKDGTIRHVVGAFNPQGCRVWSFREPSAEERSHDFLWRVAARTPARGEIAVFNRSHYEDVLVVRVHRLVPASVWSRRFDHINAFERMLVDEGTTILKFFLAIDRDEQRRRLQARLDQPDKTWKFSRHDVAERARWKAYRTAFEDCLSKTSTDWAPWYLIPANHKWFRNLAVARIVGDALSDLRPAYPRPEPNLAGLKVE